MAADGSIIIDTKIDTSGFQQSIPRMQSGLKSIANMVKKVGIAAGMVFATKKLIDFGKSAIELGSDLEEVENVVDTVFTTMSDKVNEFADNAAFTAGMSETMAKKYIGTFGAMARSFGFTESEAFDMSVALAQLAGDVASFYNLTQDEAYTKLKSVFTGETESLKELGVVMTQTALDSYAMANGFGKTVSAMSEQEKVALRYSFVMNQMSAASGDFIRTSGGLANQVRVMRLQIESLMATIGQGLINLFTPVIKVINTLLAKLATVANAFKAFTELLTGNKSSGATGKTDAGLVDSETYTEAANGAESLADATDEVVKSTKKAQQANKGYLSGLDEIRKYSSDSDTQFAIPGPGNNGGGSGGISAVDYGSTAKGTNQLEETSTLLDRLIVKFNELGKIISTGYWDGLKGYEPILNGLQSDMDSIGKHLAGIFSSGELIESVNGFVESFLYSMGAIVGTMSKIGITIAANLLGGVENALSQSGESIETYLIDMFDIHSEIYDLYGSIALSFGDVFSVFGSEIAQQISGSIMSILLEVGVLVSETAAKLGRDLLDMVAKPFIDNKDLIKDALFGTLEALQPFVTGVLTAIQRIREQVGIFYGTYLKPFFDSIGEGLSNIFTTLLEGYNTYIQPVIESIGKMATEFLNGPFMMLVESVLGFLGKAIEMLQKIWTGIIVPLIEWIVKNVLPVIMPIIEKLAKIAFDLLGTIAKVASGILDAMGGLIDFIVGVFSGDWELAFSGLQTIGEGFKKVVGAIFGFLQNNIFTPFSNFLSGVFSTDWSESFGFIGEIMNGFLGGVETIIENAKEIFGSIISFIQNVFEGDWEGAWNAAIEAFGNIWEGLTDLLKMPINGVIGLLNGLIACINTMLATIESHLDFKIQIPNPFSKGYMVNYHWSATLPRIKYSIPYLATGAVIPPNAPFMAMLGDQRHGTNIEAPLSTIEDALENVLARTGMMGGNSGSYRFTAQINRRTLFDEFIEEAKIRQSATGINPLELA